MKNRHKDYCPTCGQKKTNKNMHKKPEKKRLNLVPLGFFIALTLLFLVTAYLIYLGA